MAYRRKAVSLSDFEPTEETSDSDLLKLTFENGQAIFVHYRGFRQHCPHEPIWILHEDFCPSSIQMLRTTGMNYRDDVKGQPFDVPLEITATVGEPASISIWPRLDDKTASALASIEPCAYRDAYHDDLELAVSVYA
jgi:hypothetical protein